MRRLAILILAGGACAVPDPAPQHEFVYVSDPYTIDRKYQSMQGPSATVEVTVGDPAGPPELVWVTGYRAEVVGPDGETRLPPEFMCHSNLGFDADAHREIFGWQRRTARRLFTVSQGQESIAFPDGTGIPLMSNEALTLTTQVLNHNYPDTTLQARVRVTITYLRDNELTASMTPLYMKSANALVRLDGSDGVYGGGEGGGHHDMEGPGSPSGMAAGNRVIRDSEGREFAGHWIVPPGRQENRTIVTNWMNVPPEARVHFIAVHLHPFAHTVALRNLTRDETVFDAEITRFPDRIGLAHVEAFSSVGGVPLRSGDEYALDTVYDNPTAENQEAMAVMYLYLRDDEFRKPGR